MLPALIGLAALSPQPETVLVTRDDTVIDRSCRIVIPADTVIEDDEGDGVIHVTASDIEIVFDPKARLVGSTGDPDERSGVGIRIIGQSNVVVRDAVIEGFKVGLWATDADGVELHDIDVRSNFAQHLGSTPMAEDASDWLWPHRNDDNEWMRNYGASIWIEDSDEVTVRGVKVRHAQNGIVLDTVRDARVYDNDASFLSGWGLAMWRTTDSVIARNAFDFCVRGYSHGIYNRGQDSAGLLVFEQCSNNIFAENSATHGGDGLFAFAGHDALGEQWYTEKRLEAEQAGRNPDEVVVPDDVIEAHRGRGNNGNLFIGNDLSHAVAHGLELTFSFDNVLARNTFRDNGICGIWGGYSQGTLITENTFVENGHMGYGLERGGVNIEHGFRN
ncbi:MAG: right-handed parallel beta-helix repeat-containing protein, partial [Phycisphaerales bacterium]|nr:right-handed parallel beta-helix repeat-containing protein [Phycisphaerales bacterium]